MGQTLSEPVTTKETETVSNANYRVAASCMQGWRINMEDKHTMLLSLKEDKDAAFFAVFDGHGGSRVANYCGEYLHKKIVTQQGYDKGDIVDAMKSGFLRCDDDMRQDESMKDEMAGSTAICILIKNNSMYSANCGDSRAVASVRGKVQELSFDHKPSNEGETKRIIAAGGWVEFNRVNGNLALSRAMGDFMFKRNTNKSPEEQIVTAYPDVTVKKLSDDHEFVFLACDGIWDVMSNEEVVDYVRSRIAKKHSPEQICEEILGHCLAPDCQMGGLGCDNMTVILVCLLNGGTYEDLARKCARQADSPMNENGSASQDDEEKNMDLT